MKDRRGYLQGYNAQVAVDEHGVVLAAQVSADAGDVGQLVPMLKELTANLAASGAGAEVGTALFDAGYWSERNATAERRRPAHRHYQVLETTPKS